MNRKSPTRCSRQLTPLEDFPTPGPQSLVVRDLSLTPLDEVNPHCVWTQTRDGDGEGYSPPGPTRGPESKKETLHHPYNRRSGPDTPKPSSTTHPRTPRTRVHSHRQLSFDGILPRTQCDSELPVPGGLKPFFLQGPHLSRVVDRSLTIYLMTPGSVTSVQIGFPSTSSTRPFTSRLTKIKNYCK